MTSTKDSHHWRPVNTSIPSFNFTELTDGKDDVKRFGPYGFGLTLDNGCRSTDCIADLSTPTNDQKICIQLVVDLYTIGSGSLLLSMDPAPSKKEPVLAQFNLELVNKAYLVNDDLSKNVCLDKILHFTSGKEDHHIWLDLEKLKADGFLHIDEDSASPYLWVSARMHLLRNIGPCIYLSNAERSEMIATYGAEVIKALKEACMNFLLEIENAKKKGLLGTWSALEPAAKQDFLNPVEKTVISELIRRAFPDCTSLLYPLMMEMMHYGVRNADNESNRFAQLMGTSESPDEFSVKGDFDVIMKKKLKAYMRWAKSNTEQSELLNSLQSAGWCTVQVFTIHQYFCYVVLMHQKPETEIKSAVKGSKEKMLKEVYEEPEPELDELEELNIDDAHATTLVNLPAAGLSLFIPSQKIICGLVEWMRPTEEEIYKVDCDGAFTKPKMNESNTKVVKEGHGGYSCVVRRVKNRVPEVIIAVAGASKPESSFYHEVEGVLCGSHNAWKNKCRRVEISTDCKQAILEVKRGIARTRQVDKDRRRSKKICHMINRIIELNANFDTCKLFHMFRGANEVANKLCHICKYPEDDKYYKQIDFERNPDLKGIKDCLDDDARGAKYYPKGIIY